MREIRFRGKRIDIGRWVEGSYLKMFHGLHMDGNHYIHFIVDTKGIRYEVYPETIGQYTGMIDQNGKEIYEGDILRMDDGVKNQFVKWSDWMAGFVMVLSDTSDSTDIPSNCEVIGNIYENPELLKGEESE